MDGVTVFWRPGCGFCAALLRGLDRAGLDYEQRDIWEDEDAADFVRRHAGGNETVPTVAIGEVVLVNPPAGEVLALAATHAPSALPAGEDA